MKKCCIYTCLLGGYEHLNDQPVAKESLIPFICFTDNKKLTSDVWKVIYVEPSFAMDPMRSQRIVKAKPWDFLPEYDFSIYIDNSVVLKETPEKILNFYNYDGGLALSHHSFRDSVMDEFIEVSRLGLDDQSRIFEQLNHYMIDCPEILEEKPFWGGMLIREHNNPNIRRMGEIWLEHILRYSRRDQLSLNLAIRSAALTPKLLDLDNRVSWLHDWPVMPGREWNRGQKKAAFTLNTPVGMIKNKERDLTLKLESLEHDNQTLKSKVQRASLFRNIAIIAFVLIQLVELFVIYKLS